MGVVLAVHFQPSTAHSNASPTTGMLMQERWYPRGHFLQNTEPAESLRCPQHSSTEQILSFSLFQPCFGGFLTIDNRTPTQNCCSFTSILCGLIIAGKVGACGALASAPSSDSPARPSTASKHDAQGALGVLSACYM